MSIVSAVDFSALGEYEMVYPNLNTRRLVREGILFLLKFVFFLAHFTTTLDTFFTFGHLQTSLHAAHLIRTFFPSLMYTPLRVGGDERRWPERVCQEAGDNERLSEESLK